MAIEMDENQHPDSIWTWKSNYRRGKVSLWIPYLINIEKIKGNNWRITYNSGQVDVYPKQLDCIMFYGASGAIPLAFIDDMAQQRVAILIHRRNLTMPVCFLPGQKNDNNDVLTKQILFRNNHIRRCYIARTLVHNRFNSVRGTLKCSDSDLTKLRKLRDIDNIRIWEANKSKKYWANYFKNIGFPEATRRGNSPISTALDAGSMFMTGIILRWVLVHKLSPSHGYLHVQTGYMSLVYDLIEPYRYILEKAVALASESWDGENEKQLTAFTLSALKELLDSSIYIPMARQKLRRKNLLHGVVLALRAYLTGDMHRFVVPTEGIPSGGRPIKASYKLPGSLPRIN